MGRFGQSQSPALPAGHKLNKKNKIKFNISRKIFVQLQDKPSFLLPRRRNRLKFNPS